MKRVHITFPCGDIELEGVWHLPDANGPFPAVVVCHPHSLHGGNMSNNVVFAACQALAQNSIAALRFNFRGVRNSGGKYGDGVGEQDDVRAALAYVLSTPDIDPVRLGLAGYSFGGGVAVPVAAENEAVKMLALVAPALTDSSWKQLKQYPRPLFLIHGEDDFVITTDLVQQHLGGSTESRHYEVIGGADHFLGGYEAAVAEKIAGFFAAGFSRV